MIFKEYSYFKCSENTKHVRFISLPLVHVYCMKWFHFIIDHVIFPPKHSHSLHCTCIICRKCSMALKSKLSHAGWFAEKVSGVIFFFAQYMYTMESSIFDNKILVRLPVNFKDPLGLFSYQNLYTHNETYNVIQFHCFIVN